MLLFCNVCLFIHFVKFYTSVFIDHSHFMKTLFCPIFFAFVFSVQAVAVSAAPHQLADWSVVAKLPEVADYLPTKKIELALIQDANDGQFDEHSLLDAMLLAEGCDSEKQIKSHKKKIAAHIPSIKKAAMKLSEKQQAKLVLEYLHKNVFTGNYKENCSSVSATINSGVYNCVSSSVIYAYFARALGLKICFERKPGHVYCLVMLDGKYHPIETTSRLWEKSTQAASLDSKSKAVRLSDTQMVSLIYYNRGVALFQQLKYPQSIAVNFIALQFDPANQTASGNVVSAINNWSLDLYENKQYQIATQILSVGLTLDSKNKNLLTSEAFLFSQWIELLRKTKHYQKSLTIIGQVPKRKYHRQLIKQNYQVLYRSWNECAWML